MTESDLYSTGSIFEIGGVCEREIGDGRAGFDTKNIGYFHAFEVSLYKPIGDARRGIFRLVIETVFGG